jgi:hypothetical protein
MSLQHVLTLNGPSSVDTIDTFQQQGKIDTFQQHTFQQQGATGMYQLYSLRMALLGLKHVGMKYSVNKMEF